MSQNELGFEVKSHVSETETEEDGIRQAALRIGQYLHQNEQMRQRTSAKIPTGEQLQEREKRRLDLQIKKAEAIANAERDAPIRARFHDWLEVAGFRRFDTPALGSSYPSAHVEALWEAYVDATLREREGQK